MSVQIHYNQPSFWTPANALGKAATVTGELNGRSVEVRFYWSGRTETKKRRTMRQLNEEAIRFLRSYRPKHVNEPTLHFLRDGSDFKRILDPGWIPIY